MLRGGFCSQTLFMKALVPFQGHVLVQHKIWMQLMSLAGRNMNVLR
jgi:hypothetical protein